MSDIVIRLDPKEIVHPMRCLRWFRYQILFLAYAMAMLAVMPATAAEVPVPGAVTDAIGWYEKEAAAGNPDAQFLLARLMEQGLLGAPDQKGAFRWYQRAATNGHSGAQMKLADTYYFGGAVVQDYVKALAWYGKAANAGIVRAQYNLALMLERGRGGPADIAKAAAFYIKAATAGLGEAQIGLSMLYAHGQGVKKDAVRALMWLNIAAAQGQLVPVGIRDAIASDLSEERRLEARRLAEEWLALRPGRK